MITVRDVLPLKGKGISLPTCLRQHAPTPTGRVWGAASAAFPVPVGVLVVTILQGTAAMRDLLFRHGRVAALLLISSVEIDLGRWAIVPVQRSMSAIMLGGVSVAHLDSFVEER